MKLTSTPQLEAQARALQNSIRSVGYASEALTDWHVTTGTEVRDSQDALEAFTAGALQLQDSTFAEELLEEWSDELEELTNDYPNASEPELREELLSGYLSDFTGSTLEELVAFYLSPAGIASGAWIHDETFKSTDGRYEAYTFAALSFQRHDGFLWLHETATGQGYALPHSRP